MKILEDNILLFRSRYRKDIEDESRNVDGHGTRAAKQRVMDIWIIGLGYGPCMDQESSSITGTPQPSWNFYPYILRWNLHKGSKGSVVKLAIDFYGAGLMT